MQPIDLVFCLKGHFFEVAEIDYHLHQLNELTQEDCAMDPNLSMEWNAELTIARPHVWSPHGVSRRCLKFKISTGWENLYFGWNNQ